MNNVRSSATCAVFEERIVVTGGCDNNFNDLNTVESYDVAADSWSAMLNMIERREQHSLVVDKNKLFVIGGVFDIPIEQRCEVFDRISANFDALKCINSIYCNRALSIGTKIFIFQNDKPVIVSYDVGKDEWSEEPCEAAKFYYYRLCGNLPKLPIC